MDKDKENSISLKKEEMPASANKRLLILLIPVVSAVLITVINRMPVGENMRLWQLLAPLPIIGVECVALLLFIRHLNRNNKSK